MGNVKVIKLIDPDGVVYGIEKTGNVPHMLIGYTGLSYQFPRLDRTSFANVGVGF